MREPTLGPMTFLCLTAADATAVAQGPQRLVVVVAQPNDPRASQQKAVLARDAAALRERDVTVQQITPDAARKSRPELDVNPRVKFEVLLVGKDGEVKLRRQSLGAVSVISGLIDAMPMRQEEMRRRNGG